MKPKEVFSQEQLNASNPTENVWVQANAGTGKTKVLIQRLLRILFRNNNQDTKITSGILCLTYTNAAAGEMRNRILAGLRDWAMADDKELTELLESVSENNPATQKDLVFARKVFYTYIDNPDMLKIKTIHGFCEEILHRFPLEAGISPSWSLISGAAQTVVLDKAFNQMIKNSFNNNKKTTNTLNAFYKILDIKSEHFLSSLQELLLGRYRSFFQVNNIDEYRTYFIDTTQKILHIENNVQEQVEPEYLLKIINLAKDIEKNTKKPAKYLQEIINTTQQYIDKTINFEKYKCLYLTQQNEIAKRFLTDDLFGQEALRVYKLQQYLLNKKVFEDTVALFDLAMDF